MCCPFELKIFWGLYPTLKSSHINFQLQRTAHGGGGASAKSLIWSSKGTTCDFWPFPKKAFLGTFGCSRVLNLLIHIFLSKTDILNAIRRFDFRTFWEICKIAPNRAKNDWYLLREKSPQKCRFGSKKLKEKTNCSKFTEMVKMSWLRHLCEIFRFWSKNRHFWALFVFCRFFKIFEKSRFWRFGEGSTSAVWSPFELKIFWGLYPTLKSSHINFQLKRTAHGWGSDLEKTPKSTFSKILKNRLFAKNCQKVVIFWPKTKNFAQIS